MVEGEFQFRANEYLTYFSLSVSVVNAGWRRITGYSWTCHQRV